MLQDACRICMMLSIMPNTDLSGWDWRKSSTLSGLSVRWMTPLIQQISDSYRYVNGESKRKRETRLGWVSNGGNVLFTFGRHPPNDVQRSIALTIGSQEFLRQSVLCARPRWRPFKRSRPHITPFVATSNYSLWKR